MRTCVGYCDYRLHDRDRMCIGIKKDSSTEHGLGAGVVKTLTSDFKGKYHHVYFDNFFTSLQLLEDLENNQIYSCGTARKDRKGSPDQLKKPNLKNRCVL